MVFLAELQRNRPDQGGRFSRRAMVSALTIFGAHEISAHHCSYVELADAIRARFTNPRETLHEMFLRMVFNILVGNTDDHARNHAAFWDGKMLTLTPAYDIAPQIRPGYDANQAILISATDRRSQVERKAFAGRQFLNPYAFDELGAAPIL